MQTLVEGNILFSRGGVSAAQDAIVGDLHLSRFTILQCLFPYVESLLVSPRFWQQLEWAQAKETLT